MIAAFVLMFSCVALVQFFTSYCRSLLASYATVEISAVTRELIGMQNEEIAGEEFHHVLGLVRLAPNPGDDKWDLRVISLYYRAVKIAGLFGAAARGWAAKQSSLCAYFAAAALERRITAVTAR